MKLSLGISQKNVHHIKLTIYAVHTSIYMSGDLLSGSQHAMEVMDVSGDVQNDVLNIIAGILHLGNIAFTEEGNYSVPEDDGCK